MLFYSVLILIFVSAFECLQFVNEYKPLPNHNKLQHIVHSLPHTYLNATALPNDFSWMNVNGTTYVSKSLNQHIPQYCGSCWAHGALSSFADRVKIARKAKGADINFSIQFILNCGDAGSCHGGDHIAVFEFIKKYGYVPYDTCLPYEACSSESTEGRCKGGDYTCKRGNICRTCSTFTEMGGKCTEIDFYPNATIAEYGSVSGADKMKTEIYARGPIACGINADPLRQYTGGILDSSESQSINHIISVIGWGTSQKSNEQYWIVRNSWGEYWGELGFFRIKMGQNQLGIEGDCAWATPASWTEHNFPCYEDGSNCVLKGSYVDPGAKL